MAIFHLNAGLVSRSTGRSCVQSASYITRGVLYETRRGITANYSNRSDLVFSQTLAPSHAPAHFKDIGVWDLLENHEDIYAAKRYPKCLASREKYLQSAQTAQTIVVALPCELDMEANKELMRDYTNKCFVSRGLIATYAIHFDEGNPHAHIQVSRRSVTLDGTLSWAKDREIVSKKGLLATRELWAEVANHHLQLHGHEARINEKSFLDLGINLEPSVKRGWYVDQNQSKGMTSRIVQENLDIRDRNKQTIQEDPSILVKELTASRATFCQKDLLLTIQKRMGGDPKSTSTLFEQALQQAVFVGEGMDGEKRYTSQHYKRIEERAITSMGRLCNVSHGVIRNVQRTHNYLEKHFNYLSCEQREAVVGLTDNKAFCVLVGRAGAGKTTTLKAVGAVYEKRGMRVIGTSLSALAAQNLEDEAGFKSHTLASLLYGMKTYEEAAKKFLSFDSIVSEGVLKQLDWYKDLKRFEKFKLDANSVVIVDEAGMVGTKSWDALLGYVASAGAKLIAVGDDNQFKAIEGGDFFRLMKGAVEKQGNLFSLNVIRRQKQEWMREASVHLSDLKADEALGLYEQKGHIHQTSGENLAASIAKAFVEQTLEHKGSGVVLAFTNDQVTSINAAIKEELQAKGLLPSDTITIQDKTFAVGEKIIFLKNDPWYERKISISDDKGRDQSRKVIKNGTIGTIERIDHKGTITFRLEDNHVATLKAQTTKVSKEEPSHTSAHSYDYDAIATGYCVTTHKSQGQTRDHTIIALSQRMDVKSLYVALTRHAHTTSLFYAQEDFKDFQTLARSLNRFENKDLLQDYSITPQNEQQWNRVRDYRLSVLETAQMASTLKNNGTQMDGVDWKSWRLKKEEQKILGQEILNDFKAHEPYLARAGLTKETLEIRLGLKERALSNEEQGHKDYFETYKDALRKTRQSLIDIRADLSDPRAIKSHKDYPLFDEHRNARNELASTIADNFPHYKEFAHTLTISRKTIEAHQRQHNERIQRQQDIAKDIAGNTEHTSVPLGRETQREGLPKRTWHKESCLQQAKSTPRFDVKAVEEKLLDHIEAFADHVMESMNLSHDRMTSSGAERRYGKKGHISLNTKTGMWLDHKDPAMCGGPLALLVKLKGLNFKESLSFAASFVGMDDTPTIHPKRLQTSKFADKNIENNETLLTNKINRARHLWNKGQSIQGTIAARYLTHTRKITAELLDDVRFLPKEPHNANSHPSLMVVGRNTKGEITAVQITAIDPTTYRKADIPVPKRSHGAIKGSFVTLQKQSEIQQHKVLYVAEGVETALSLASLDIDGTIIATLGLANMKHIQVSKDTKIVLCADHDAPDSPARKTLAGVIQALKDKEYDVHVLTPRYLGQDFNDTLKGEGREGIITLMEEQLPTLKEPTVQVHEANLSPKELSFINHMKDAVHDRKVLGIVSKNLYDPDPTSAKANVHMRQTLIEKMRFNPYTQQMIADDYLGSLGREISDGMGTLHIVHCIDILNNHRDFADPASLKRNLTRLYDIAQTKPSILEHIEQHYPDVHQAIMAHREHERQRKNQQRMVRGFEEKKSEYISLEDQLKTLKEPTVQATTGKPHPKEMSFVTHMRDGHHDMKALSRFNQTCWDPDPTIAKANVEMKASLIEKIRWNPYAQLMIKQKHFSSLSREISDGMTVHHIAHCITLLNDHCDYAHAGSMKRNLTILYDIAQKSPSILGELAEHYPHVHQAIMEHREHERQRLHQQTMERGFDRDR